MAGRGQISGQVGSHQEGGIAYRGRLGGSHTNLEALSEGNTEYHGLLSVPHAAPSDVGPDGVGTLGPQNHEAQQASVYLGRLSGPRFSNDSGMESVDYHTPAPSQTTVPKLNNPQDVSVQTAYRGRLSSCNSRKNMWDAASHVEAS